MRWEQISGKTGYIQTKGMLIPTYQISNNELLLFDSGTEASTELLDDFERRGVRICAVLNTHLHIDHIANNLALVEKYGAKIFAGAEEIAASQKRRSLPYPVVAIQDANAINIEGIKIGVLPTPGHSAGHLAYVTPDGVCCVGDALMSENMIRRSKMPYMEDVDGAIVSMEKIRLTRYPFYIAAHKGVTLGEKMPALVDENIKKELDLYDLLRRQIKAPTPAEQVLANFIQAAGIHSPKQKTQKTGFIEFTARVRLEALIDAGEFYMENGIIYPN